MNHFVHTGKAIGKIMGKGAVAVVTDEVLVGMVPTRINGVDNCIAIKIHDSQDCCGVHPELSKQAQMALIRELEEEGTEFVYLTMPMCHRSRAEGWAAAADLLELLAKVAREQAWKPVEK